MPIHNNILSFIGDTPIVELHSFDTGPCQLFIKLESQNPGGSIKDRIALHMIEAAEKSGELKPGATIVAAVVYCQQQEKAKRVLTFACDGGAKYLSKLYNDDWMAAQGFVDESSLISLNK